MFTQLPRVPSLIPRSRATSAIGLPVSSTICTASALNCGLNFLRCSGMDTSSQVRGRVQDRWYTPIATRPWLTVFRLPPYAHELNPVELVWAHLKRSLANLTKHTIAELTVLVKTRLKRMQYRPALLAGFLASTGLEYGPIQQHPLLTIVNTPAPRTPSDRR